MDTGKVQGVRYVAGKHHWLRRVQRQAAMVRLTSLWRSHNMSGVQLHCKQDVGGYAGLGWSMSRDGA